MPILQSSLGGGDLQMQLNSRLKSFAYAAVLFSCFANVFGCKPQNISESASVSMPSQPGETPVAHPTAGNVSEPRSGLTIAQWLTKDGVSEDEARTVDVILANIISFGGPANDPKKAARWAESNLNVIGLDGEKLTNISPLLAFENITTLGLTGNKFTQAQINELLASLPKLRILSIDPYLSCNKETYPKVTCLK